MEMTLDQRRRLRELLPQCANYDRATKTCLPLDDACYMQHKLCTGAFCRYFSESVLPLDATLQAELSGNSDDLTPCAQCSRPFPRAGRMAYCSAACRQAANRAKSRERMRRMRENKQHENGSD